jgi:hypothetical protein
MTWWRRCPAGIEVQLLAQVSRLVDHERDVVVREHRAAGGGFRDGAVGAVHLPEPVGTAGQVLPVRDAVQALLAVEGLGVGQL